MLFMAVCCYSNLSNYLMLYIAFYLRKDMYSNFTVHFLLTD